MAESILQQPRERAETCTVRSRMIGPAWAVSAAPLEGSMFSALLGITDLAFDTVCWY